MPRKPRTPVWSSPDEQFDSKYIPVPESGCWLWTSTEKRSRKRDPKSAYPVMKIGGRKGPVVRAHRFAYERCNGPIPKGAHVLHRCDTPMCVNPGHLFLGNNDDNVLDKTLKGRAAKKLTPEQVDEIRAASGSQREIAKRYGVSHTMVGYIKRKDFWAWHEA